MTLFMVHDSPVSSPSDDGFFCNADNASTPGTIFFNAALTQKFKSILIEKLTAAKRHYRLGCHQ